MAQHKTLGLGGNFREQVTSLGVDKYKGSERSPGGGKIFCGHDVPMIMCPFEQGRMHATNDAIFGVRLYRSHVCFFLSAQESKRLC